MTALTVVQGLHVLAGVAWAGGQLTMAVAVLPALFRLEPPATRAALSALGPPLGALMASTGAATMVLGLVRGVAFGPVRSFAMLYETGYGRAFVAAVALALLGAVHGARAERRLAGLFVGDERHPAAGRRLAADAALTVALVAALVGCMVLMHFGG